jgi:hypothetical protein
MERLSVSSSNLAAVGYDPSTKTLEVEFNSGSIYRYSGVSLSVFNALMAAESHGKYFNAHIRNTYSYRQVR